MDLNDVERATRAAAAFELPGSIAGCAPHAGGHINRSFVIDVATPTERRRFLLQELNTRVFTRPELVTENIRRVAEHLRRKFTKVADVGRRMLTPIGARAGGSTHVDAEGRWWRLFNFIDDVRVDVAVRSPEQARLAGIAFGEFQRLTADLDDPPLAETIPGFHDTPARFDQWERAVAEDRVGRRAGVSSDIDFLRSVRPRAGAIVDALRSGAIPQRVAHNDCKMTNILLDRQSGAPVCVVDWDTVMPGSVLCDFGDMVRSMTSTAAEDATEDAPVAIDLAMFAALASGYWSSVRSFLTPAEKALLVASGVVITFEQALRFSADDLNGDVYYAVSRSRQNLDRARSQIKLLKSILRAESEMEAVVARL